MSDNLVSIVNWKADLQPISAGRLLRDVSGVGLLEAANMIDAIREGKTVIVCLKPEVDAEWFLGEAAALGLVGLKS